MLIRNARVFVIVLTTTVLGLGNVAVGADPDAFVDQILSVYADGGDHMRQIRQVRDQTELYPKVVAALSDYTIFDHGTLLDLLFEKEGEAIIHELDQKLKSEIACLPEYESLCQSNLAERNSAILNTLSHYEEETRK